MLEQICKTWRGKCTSAAACGVNHRGRLLYGCPPHTVDDASLTIRSLPGLCLDFSCFLFGEEAMSKQAHSGP